MPSAMPRNRQVRDTARRMSRVDRGAIENWHQIGVSHWKQDGLIV